MWIGCDADSAIAQALSLPRAGLCRPFQKTAKRSVWRSVQVGINLISSQEFDPPVLLSNIYNKAWGKPWPQSKGNIDKDGVINEPDDNDSDNPLRDLLTVHSPSNTTVFLIFRSLHAFSEKNSQMGNILVVHKEYPKIFEALNKDKRNIVLTGQGGIGAYKRWS